MVMTMYWLHTKTRMVEVAMLFGADVYSTITDTVPDQFSILADSAFPNLGGKIVKPLRISDAAVASAHVQEMSRIVAGMRVPCEWGNRGLTACFARLTMPLPADHAKRWTMLYICAHLNNFRVRTMDYGQIRACFHRDYIKLAGTQSRPSNLERYLEAAMARRRSNRSA